MTVKVTPYLMMDGNAKEAIQFYEQALEAKVVTNITYAEVPDLPSEDLKNKVAHAKLKIGESVLLISDSPSVLPVEQGNQVTICISTKDAAQSKRFFEALKKEGKVKMPFQETSFSAAYGSLTDKFGVTFLIDTESENLMS
ncbi:VOC family protein [Gracilibacillus alcaliphilus]|uniref:VOC family protein n=1 Tax=Gracilibacillus alcaliphilus TaxID=1401441 RepID=UPI0019562903|nr:VOC family protein [Gracilibacillus alcaliphilus]MBM7675789.1 PhnB protein [Gracilibacillus alcaliphilus]